MSGTGAHRNVHRQRRLLRVLLGVYAVYVAFAVFTAARYGLWARSPAWLDVLLLALLGVMVALFMAILHIRRNERSKQRNERQED